MSGILQTLIYGVSVVKDAYFNLVTLLLNTTTTNGAQNNTFLDSSSNNFTITRNGNTTQGTFTPFSQTGWSDYFSSSYLQTSSAVIASTTSTFTIEAWVYMTQLPTTGGSPNVPCLIGDFAGTSSTNYWGFGPMSTGLLQFFWYDGASKSATGNTTMAANTWNHIAISVNANAISMYVNGVQQTITGTSTLTNRSSSLSYTTIGQYNTSTGVYYGYVSNMSVLSGTAKYSGSTITVPTAPLSASTTNQTLLTCASNSFADINTATTAKTLTIGGTPSVQAFSPFAPTAAYSTTTVGGSGYFDGSGDYLSLPSSSNLSFGTGDFCVEFWLYKTSSATGIGIFSNSQGSGGGDAQFEIQINSTNKIALLGWNTVFMTGSTSINQNTWTHVAAVRSGTSMALFVNGVRDATATSANNFSSVNSFVIAEQATGSGFYAGYISSLRAVKGSSIYTPSNTTLTMPTAPLTAVTNTQLLTNFTNAGIYDAAAKNDLETVGNAQVSTTQAKFGTTSMYFDGTGDYLDDPAILNAQFGTGDFTIEGWIYINSLAALQVIFDFRAASGASYGQIYITTGGVLRYYLPTDVGTSNTFSTTTWTHFAITRASGTLNMYINGTRGYTATYSSAMDAAKIRIGADVSGGSGLNAYLDEIRITKGYARYTGSTLTVPTAAFPVQ